MFVCLLVFFFAFLCKVQKRLGSMNVTFCGLKQRITQCGTVVALLRNK